MICKVCKCEKEQSTFAYTISKGKVYYKFCADCRKVKDRERYLKAKESELFVKKIRERERLRHEKTKSDPILLAKKREYCNISNQRRKQSEKYLAWLSKRKDVMKQRLFEKNLQKAIEQGPTEIVTGECVCCGSITIVKAGVLLKCKKCIKDGIVKCYNKTKYNCSSCGVEYLSTKMNKGVCTICRDKQRKKSDLSKQARKAAKRARKRIVTQSVNVDLIYKRDGYKCVECKSKVVKSKTYKPNQATIDHIIPIAKGGSHTIDNLQTMCQSCNSKKRDIVKDGTQIGIFCAIGN